MSVGSLREALEKDRIRTKELETAARKLGANATRAAAEAGAREQEAAAAA